MFPGRKGALDLPVGSRRAARARNLYCLLPSGSTLYIAPVAEPHHRWLPVTRSFIMNPNREGRLLNLPRRKTLHERFTTAVMGGQPGRDSHRRIARLLSQSSGPPYIRYGSHRLLDTVLYNVISKADAGPRGAQGHGQGRHKAFGMRPSGAESVSPELASGANAVRRKILDRGLS